MKAWSPSSSSSSSSYRIGVLADTHGKLLPRVVDLFRGVDEIWHLGDVCDLATLAAVRQLNARCEVVLGNNDLGLNLPPRLTLERRGEPFHLVHILPKKTPAHGWLLFGHTHRPVNCCQGALQLFNPGSAGKANKGAPLSVGFLTWTAGKPAQAEIVPL